MIKLGSLFDGSGGFPLGGVICGIVPVWASEIEPYPIRVTTARFPNMKHLGDVTKINGAEVEPVDIITFGSPCQDLSVAGKQAGIHDGQRSSLFFQAVRIIKEMRDATAGKYPRFAVWENVPGAFTSNKGEDFRAVLQALCEIKDPAADVPQPEREKWKSAGCIVGDGFSLAWRVYDAQFWGVPQRRKRIYLIADFGSERAGEILFESESVCGHSAEGRAAREGTAPDTEGSADGSYPEVARTLTAPCADRGANVVDLDCRNLSGNEEVSATLQAKVGGGYSLNYVNPVCYRAGSFGGMVEGTGTLRANGGDLGGDRRRLSVSVYDARGNGEGKLVPTITGDHNAHISDYTAILVETYEE